jgi:hypothetical protein
MLLLTVFPLLALTLAPARIDQVPGLNQDTVRRAGQSGTQQETPSDAESNATPETISNQSEPSYSMPVMEAKTPVHMAGMSKKKTSIWI